MQLVIGSKLHEPDWYLNVVLNHKSYPQWGTCSLTWGTENLTYEILEEATVGLFCALFFSLALS